MTRAAIRATPWLDLAPVLTEGELVEIGWQVLGADHARVRAQKPAFQQRDGPVAALQAALSRRCALVWTTLSQVRSPRLSPS